MPGSKNRLTKEQRAEIVLRYCSGESGITLGREFGCSDNNVRALVRRRNLPVRSDARRPKTYTFNLTAFDERTPDADYWLGFFMGDGNVHKDCVQLRLMASDGYHVEDFRRFLQAGHPIFSDGENAIGFAIRSRVLANKLSTFGITPRKSFTAKASCELAVSRDFWRGVFDANGHIGFGRSGSPCFNLVGSLPLMTQYAEFIGALDRLRVHKSIWSVCLSGDRARHAARRLYFGAVTTLERKRRVAIRL